MERDNIELVVAALRKVPEKRLLLIEIVNQVGVKNGEMDYEKLLDLQPQLKMAATEAKVYAGHTARAISSLLELGGKADAGFGGDDNDEEGGE
jgi:hypothetical protein